MLAVRATEKPNRAEVSRAEQRRIGSMKMVDAIEIWPVAKLQPYERNPRKHTAHQIKQIAASITEFGFLNPIIVDKHDGIIAGHGRLEAAKILLLENVPVMRAEHLTDAQKRAYVIADNRLAESASWDLPLLAGEISLLDHDGIDLELLGFTTDELAAMVSTIPEDEGKEHDENAADDVRYATCPDCGVRFPL